MVPLKESIFSFLLFLLLLAGNRQVGATHIVGGELNYKYLGGNVYQISLTVYRDCYNGVPPFDNPASVGIFHAVTNVFIREKLFTFTQLDTVPPTINAPCFVPPVDICYERTVYTDTVVLPPSSSGYILAYQRCCRNITILNLITPQNTGATYEAWLAGTSSFSQNSNPVFTNWPPPFICAGVPFVFDHSATDFEGDSIVYELVTPLTGGTLADPMPQPPLAPPYQQVVFQPPYSLSNVLGANSNLSIDPVTGELTAFPTIVGQFVIGVRAKEFRGGILTGYTLRDFQLNVVPCPTLVVAALQNPLLVCGSNTVSFQNNSFNAGGYSWNFGVSSTISDTSNAFAPTFTYPDTGTYTVTLVAYSSVDPTCADTTTGTVTILPDYSASFTYTLDTCSNTVSFQDTSNAQSGFTAQHSWFLGDGTSSNISDPVHTYAGSGNYPVQLIATSDRGCVDTVNQSLFLPPLLDAQIVASTPPSCDGDCNGTAAVLNFNGLAPYSISWNDPLQQTSLLADSLCPGSYQVTVTDARGCQDTASIQINPAQALTLSAAATVDYCGGICGGTATALASGGNPPLSFSWNDPQNQNTATAVNLCPGTYSVVLSDQNGCTLQTQVQVVYTDSFPTVQASADTTSLFLGQSTQLNAITSVGSFNFSWSPAIGLNNTGIANPVSTPTSTTTYLVTATDANGCPVTDSVTIVVREVVCEEPEIFIPTAFSPNNDQRNDVFYVRGNTIESMQLVVYDRWGEKVFESNSPAQGWDGTFRGKPLPPDVYAYYLTAICFNQSTFLKKGNITLLR